MFRNGFTDIGDLGNREECDKIDNASYNILQLNLTQLPIEIRLGLCIPAQCTHLMMADAGSKMSESLTTLSHYLGGRIGIELLEMYEIGINITFTQPTTWYQVQREEKTHKAAIVGVVLILFFAFVAVSSVSEQLRKKKSIKDELPTAFNKKDNVAAIMAAEEERRRESTKPFTFKFKGGATEQDQMVDSVGNLVSEQEEQENSVLDNEHFEKREQAPQKEVISFWNEFLKCFSLKDNIYTLGD